VLAAVGLLAVLAAPGAGQAPPPFSPGPQHELLLGLVGEWTVLIEGRTVGTAVARTRLEGRFVEVAIEADAGPVRNVLYTFGFDDRHDVFTVIAMDDSGTYWVTGKGVRSGDVVPMYGEDDDPVMTEMGLEKEFVIELGLPSADSARIETRLIDTRTPERAELPFLAFELRR
jgi:hypothetical protein